MSEPREMYQTQSAVLFIIFNRPDTTARVFEEIKLARPPRLYIAADGPRASRAGEELLCKQARHIATQINWDCDVKTLFNDANAGCKNAVAGAITWFFENEEEGIILEDDCLPDNSFFRFCDVLLSRYRQDERVKHIAGGNFQHGKKWGDASYYFSSLTHIWGWASWRRVWKDYDKELSKYTANDVVKTLTALYNDEEITTDWVNNFKAVKAHEVDTWDYQLIFTNFFNNGLCIIPNVNLISNIGFGHDATRTTNPQNTWANIPVNDIGEITHPKDLIMQIHADISSLKEKTDLTPKPNFIKKTLNRWGRSISKRIKKQ